LDQQPRHQRPKFEDYGDTDFIVLRMPPFVTICVSGGAR
jgi:hypothetical protein